MVSICTFTASTDAGLSGRGTEEACYLPRRSITSVTICFTFVQTGSCSEPDSWSLLASTLHSVQTQNSHISTEVIRWDVLYDQSQRNTKALGLSFPHLAAHSLFQRGGRSLQHLVTMLGRATRSWITPSELPAATGTKLAPLHQLLLEPSLNVFSQILHFSHSYGGLQV